MKRLTITVGQLNRYVRALLEEDKNLRGIFVRGEISNFVRHSKSGHCYFSLKDKDAAVKAVMFRSDADGLRFDPENGMAVLVQGRVSIYERDGAYQFYVTDIQPEGAGALAVAFEQVKAKLEAEGLFDPTHKQPLPEYPRRIGVVTSETGAALQDIVNVLSRRYPLATLVLSPAQVQGAEAPASLLQALRTLDATGRCDVILLGRGGGSAEDLAAFNDEKLARAVFATRTPVVSAVGHETDYTICDFVADLRAPTPSAAAELCTPSVEQLMRSLASFSLYLRQNATQCISTARQRLDTLAKTPHLREPGAYLTQRVIRLDFLSEALYNKTRAQLQLRQERLHAQAALLDSLSPLRVLERGYCAVYSGEQVITSVQAARPGQRIRVRFRDGAAGAVVEDVEEYEAGAGK